MYIFEATILGFYVQTLKDYPQFGCQWLYMWSLGNLYVGS